MARIWAPTPIGGLTLTFSGCHQHPRPGSAPGGAVTFTETREAGFLLRKRRALHAGFTHFAKQSYVNTKSHQKKGAPTVCAPALALRGTCGARFGRGLAKLAALKQRQPWSAQSCAPRRNQMGTRGAGSTRLHRASRRSRTGRRLTNSIAFSLVKSHKVECLVVFRFLAYFSCVK